MPKIACHFQRVVFAPTLPTSRAMFARIVTPLALPVCPRVLTFEWRTGWCTPKSVLLGPAFPFIQNLVVRQTMICQFFHALISTFPFLKMLAWRHGEIRHCLLHELHPTLAFPKHGRGLLTRLEVLELTDESQKDGEEPRFNKHTYDWLAEVISRGKPSLQKIYIVQHSFPFSAGAFARLLKSVASTLEELTVCFISERT